MKNYLKFDTEHLKKYQATITYKNGDQTRIDPKTTLTQYVSGHVLLLKILDAYEKGDVETVDITEYGKALVTIDIKDYDRESKAKRNTIYSFTDYLEQKINEAIETREHLLGRYDLK